MRKTFLFTICIFLVQLVDAQIVLSHNTSDNFIGTSIYGCSTCCLRWSRTFDLADFGVEDDLRITSGTTAFRVSDVNNINFQFNVYSIDEDFPSSFDEGTLLGSSQEATAFYSSSAFVLNELEFDEDIIVPAGTDRILVEVRQVEGDLVFMAGTEADTDVSWFKSDAGGCPPENYSTTDDISRPDARFYIKVLGEEFLSVQEISKERVQIFPNPTSDFLNINYAKQIKSITIVDLKGSKVGDFANNSKQLDIKHLKSGLYFLRLVKENGDLQTFQFIKS